MLFIMGDFNVNVLNYDSHTPTNDFVDAFFSKNILPCINHPTRIYGQSSTIIDNIFTNNIDSNIICGNILTHISEHFPQFLILRNANICYNHPDTFTYHYSLLNERNFIDDFKKISFNYLNSVSDVDSNYNKIFDDVTSLVSRHIPNKKCSKRELKNKSKPWINTVIKKMMKIRDRLLRKWKHSKAEGTLYVYTSEAIRLINNPNLNKSHQPLSHRRLVGDLSIYYRYFNGHCSQEIRDIIPVPLRRVRTTRSSTHSHPFQVSLPNPRTLSHKSSFIPRTCNLWNVLPSSCFPESYNLPSFKSKINKLDLICLSS